MGSGRRQVLFCLKKEALATSKRRRLGASSSRFAWDSPHLRMESSTLRKPLIPAQRQLFPRPQHWLESNEPPKGISNGKAKATALSPRGRGRALSVNYPQGGNIKRDAFAGDELGCPNETPGNGLLHSKRLSLVPVAGGLTQF